MNNLTEHFSFEEMTKTSHADFQAENMKQAVANIANMTAVCAELEKVREFVFRPVIVKSGFRYPDLNTAVGGSKSSQHLTGSAADFTVKDFDDPKGLTFIFDWASYHCNYGQLIFEWPQNSRPWIHMGLPRPDRPRTRFYFDGKIYKPV